jgi:hypothetical protein
MGGALSGVVWFLLALLFDRGVQDFNISGLIPVTTFWAGVASALSGAVTGACIAVVFRRWIRSPSRVVLFTLPIVTLPTAIVVFAVLIWTVRLPFELPYQPSLLQVVDNFLLYGVMSIFTPILYGCALLNQYAIREVAERRA